MELCFWFLDLRVLVLELKVLVLLDFGLEHLSLGLGPGTQVLDLVSNN